MPAPAHPGRLLGWPAFALRAAYRRFAALPVVWDVRERCGGRRARTGGAQGVFLPGALPRRCPRRPILAPSRDGAVFVPRGAYRRFACLPVVQDVWEPCRASRPAQGGAGSAFPRGSPLPIAQRRSFLGACWVPAWDIPVLLSDTAHKLATLIYTMLRYGQEYVDPGAEYHDRSSRWRWLARPVVNSGRRTGRLSHPASAAVVFRPCCCISVFVPAAPPAARFFFFYTCPRPRTGLSGPRLSPRAGGSVPGVFRGGRRSFQRSLRRESRGVFRPSGPPVARPLCRPRRPAAVFAGFFRRGRRFPRPVPPFPPACPPFSPARASRFPAYLLFGPQSRLQAFYLIHGVCPRSGGGRGAQRVPSGPQGRFPVGPDRPNPAARPGFFCALYIKGKKF